MSQFVSVLIPVYNAGEALIEALDSALTQVGCETEIVLVDDGSTCKVTQNIIAHYEDRITVFRKANSGPADTRNVCLMMASHDWIAWLDQDDVWLPNKLQEQLKAAEKYDAQFVYTNARLFGELDDIGDIRNDPDAMPSGDVYDQLIFDNFVTTSAVMMKRELAIGVGGHDTEVAGVDDWDMWLRIAATGARFAPVPEPLTLYRWHSMSMSKQHGRMKKLRHDVLVKALKSERGRRLPWTLRQRSIGNLTATSAWFGLSSNARQSAGWYAEALMQWPFQMNAWKGLVKSIIQMGRGESQPKPVATPVSKVEETDQSSDITAALELAAAASARKAVEEPVAALAD